MTEFKAGDWVTIGNLSWLTPGKKYEVLSKWDGDLYLIDDEGDRLYGILGLSEHYKVEKTTPPEPEKPPEEIEQNGYIYTRSRKVPHKWEWGMWAMYEGKKVFVMRYSGGLDVQISHPDFSCNYEYVYAEKLTPIID